MAKFLLGGSEKDADSKKSRARTINMVVEGGKDGSNISIRRTEGLTLFSDLDNFTINSNLLVNAGFIYVVSKSTLYRVDSDGVGTSLGLFPALFNLPGSNYVKLYANSIPGDSQILIVTGLGASFIYDDENGLVQITDSNYFNSTSATILNERFWFVRDGRNEFFGSNVSNGKIFDALTFASAEESPDDVVAIIAKRSTLYVLGERTIEHWQTINDDTLPVRRINGATTNWGIIAKDSLANVNDFFVFLANDRTIRMMQGNRLTKISDYAFELKIKGNGTIQSPGFSTITDAYGFFINGPIHSLYCITFPTEKYTWCYDLNTGVSHSRESEGLGYWRIGSVTEFDGQLIGADFTSSKLYVLDPDAMVEGPDILRSKIITPTVSYEKNATIPLIEIDMEVSQTSDPAIDPKMMVYYTKDGGNTYTYKEHVSLGKFGDHKKRVALRSFGHLVRNKDFGLKLEITDAVGVRFYGAYIYPRLAM